jgi:hypothetical protein
MEQIGFAVALTSAPPLLIGGGVVSRFVGWIVSMEGRRVGEFRCTREGDFCGQGWVERSPREPVEFRYLPDLMQALEAHASARSLMPGRRWVA